MINKHNRSKKEQRRLLIAARLKRRRVTNEEKMVIENPEETLEDTTMIVQSLTCQNCQRSNVDLTKIGLTNIRFKRKWCLMENDGIEFDLCDVCREYLTFLGDAKNKSVNLFWPAFIAKILRSYKDDIYSVWPLIPTEWRVWWLPYVQSLSSNGNITETSPQTRVRDGTKERDLMKKMYQDLSVVPWKDFRDNFEKYNTFPLVRCPWGCAEYYTPGNYVPLDAFMERLLDRSVETYSTEAKLRCSTGFRTDLIAKSAPLLGNKRMCCMPTIAFIDDQGPQILTCRYHSASTHQRYIHIPTNPCGSLTFRGDNTLAQVRVIPRTVRAFRAKKFTNSYHLNKIMGNYSGVDSINLTDLILGASFKRVLKSLHKDYIAIRGRPDYRLFLKKLARKRKLGMKRDVHLMLKDAEKAWTVNEFNELKNMHLNGSTYVPIEQAFDIDFLLRSESKREIEIIGKEEERNIIIPFMPKWPRRMIQVTNPVSSHGDPFFFFKMKGTITYLWYLMNMVHMVPYIWKSLDEEVKNNKSWEGWVLTYVTSQILPHHMQRTVSRNPFVISKCSKIPDLLDHLGVVTNSYYDALYELFEDHSTIGVFRDVSMILPDHHYNTIILCQNNNWPQHPKRLNMDWNIVFVGTKNYIYARYSDTLERNFWQWDTHGTRCKTVLNQSNILSDPMVRHDWVYLVYTRKNMLDYESMKLKILQLQGGQVRLRCSKHKYCLVECAIRKQTCISTSSTSTYSKKEQERRQKSALAVGKKINPELKCNRKIFFECPEYNCKTSICKPCAVAMQTQMDGDEFIFVPPVAVQLDEMLYETSSSSSSEFVPSSESSESDDMSILSDEDIQANDNKTNDYQLAHLSFLPITEEEELGLQDSLQDSDSSVNSIVSSDETINISEKSHSDEMETGSMSSDQEDENLKYAVEENEDIGLELLGYEDSTDDTSDQEMNQEVVDMIPTTNTGKVTHRLNIGDLAKEGRLASNHVLLNQSGNLLLRRDHKLRGNRSNRNFLQRLVATADNDSIPLIYPESTLFPDIFWSSTVDGSMIGAIPNAFLKDNSTLNNLGIAPLFETLRTRLLDPTLLTHTSCTYHYFVWDHLANLGLRGSNTEVVLRRGWIHKPGYEGIRMDCEDDPVYDEQAIDTRATVNRLAAANARKPVDLFFTWTNNQSQSFATRGITKWVESEEAIDEAINQFNCLPDEIYDQSDREEIKRGIRESAAIILLRSWMEAVKVFTLYLQYGKDSPLRSVLGGIENVFNRIEIQAEVDSKPPHCHTLLYLKNHPTTEEGAADALDLIRGSLETFATKQEKLQLIEKGFVEEDDMTDFLLDMQRKLKHNCTSRCRIVEKKKKKDDGKETFYEEQISYRCKCPDLRRMNPNNSCHYFMPIDVHHSRQALLDLSMLGLIEALETIPERQWKCIPKSEYAHLLETKRHVPPCYATDWKYSPGNPFLYAMLYCAMNLQFCTSYLILRYLAKYVASVDKAHKIVVKKEKGDDRTLKLKQQDDHNTKITGNAIEAARKKKESKDDTFKFEGRNLSQNELVMQMFDYPTIIKTQKDEYIPTSPMGMRPVLRKTALVMKLKMQGDVPGNAEGPADLDVGRVFPNYRARVEMRFSDSRQFDSFQQITYMDAAFQSGSMDRVTIFGLRCPELRWFKRVPKYFIYFVFEPLKEYKDAKDCDHQTTVLLKILKERYKDCPWVDGMGRLAKVRKLAVPKILDYLQTDGKDYIEEDFGTQQHYDEVLFLFKTLNEWCCACHSTKSEWTRKQRRIIDSEIAQRFIHEDFQKKPTQIPVYWFRTVRASSSPEAFLVHLLISLGSFVTEYELMSQGTLQASFKHARLYTKSCDIDEQIESCTDLIRQYVIKQLAHMPAGTRTFDRELVAASQLIPQFLIHDRIVSDSIPAALFTCLQKHCEQQVIDYVKKTQSQLLDGIMMSLSTVFDIKLLPKKQDVLNATKLSPILNFNLANLPCPTDQPKESFDEHHAAYLEIEQMVKHYKAATNERTKSICYIGAGGVGKTNAMRLSGLYCMSQGLNVLSTTLTGKRGAENAGQHIHVLFILHSGDNISVVASAEKSVKNLLSNPKQWELLRRVDVILLDELGQIDSRLLTVLDMVMRRIRHSTLWFGGVLLVTTMDIKQLKPIKGLPPLLNPSMISSFRYHEFKVILRTFDKPLQRLQQISRMPASYLRSSPEIKDEIKHLLVEAKCNFIKNIDDPKIPQDAVYCFPRNETCARVEKQVLRKLTQKFGKMVVCSKSIDMEETRLQVIPVAASKTTSRALDAHNIKLPSKLYFFPFAVYEFTHNCPNHRFFTSQLCMILKKLPTQEDLNNWIDIEVYVAPPGTNIPPCDKPTERKLFGAGWSKIKVGKHPERKYKLGYNGLVGMRCQYALRHHISLTIHAIMGSTVHKLVVEIGTRHKISLWEAAQVVVLLSRTRFGKDIFFIGELEDVADAIWNALLKKDQFTDYIGYIVKQLTARSSDEEKSSFAIDVCKMHPFRSKDIQLPRVGENCCYILVSSKDNECSYVGWTNDLSARLNKHNSASYASEATFREHLKPWCLFAYVIGFDSKSTAMKFETRWQGSQKILQGRTGKSLSYEDKLGLVYDLANDHLRSTGEKLKLMKIGKLKTTDL